MKKNKIVLIGMPGSGKTYSGAFISKSLNITFIDSDKEIEIAANMSITEIFQIYGEKHFRDGETKVIKRILNNTKPRIVAIGGGAWATKKNRDIIRKKANVIFIDTPLKVIYNRIKNAKHRPIFNNTDIYKKLTKIFEERINIYKKADYTIPCDKNNHKKLITLVKEILNKDEKKN